MKYYTVPLMNEVKQRKKIKAFFFGDSRRTIYYQATHKTEDIFIMWIEGLYFGKVTCYPCVLKQGEETLVFESGKLDISQENNDNLIQRWNLVTSPETIREEYDVVEMEKNAFGDLFGEYRRRHLDAELEKVMEEEIREMEPEQQEEALQALEEAKVKNQEEIEQIKREKAEKAEKKKKKGEVETVEPEDLEEIEDETLKQALTTAREQAAKEDEQA